MTRLNTKWVSHNGAITSFQLCSNTFPKMEDNLNAKVEQYLAEGTFLFPTSLDGNRTGFYIKSLDSSASVTISIHDKGC